MEDKEAMIEHLKIVQGVINRMAQTSFILKGWAITVVSAILGFAVGTSNGNFGLVAIAPGLIFWGLDSYYLWQERLYRRLYELVRTGDQSIPPFSMNTTPCKKTCPGWLRTVWSRTECAIYLSITLFILLVSYAAWRR
jgi:uncharacterized membrane protein